MKLLVAALIALQAVMPWAVAAASPSQAGTVTAVSGQVTVARPATSPRPLKFRDPLFWRDVVEARKNSIARVLLGGKTTVTVRELSRLELRQQSVRDGVRYTAELVKGKIRASVARRLMRPGESVRVRTRNVVASVRGTDFIVETLKRPSYARAFGLLGVREVAQAVSTTGSAETVVLTLSGLVEVLNPLEGTGRVEHVGPYQGVRVTGRLSPVRFQVTTDDLRLYLRGLTPPRPRGARSGDQAPAVGKRVEKLALGASAPTVGTVFPRVTAPAVNVLPKGRVLSPTTTRVIARPEDRTAPPAAGPPPPPPPPPLPVPPPGDDDD